MIAALVAVLSALALSRIERGPEASTEQKAAREGSGKQRKVAAQASVPANPNYGPPVVLAHLEDQSLQESSGLAASRRTPDLFWTHNDSGDGPLVYAFDRAGRSRGTWRVSGASARDWEDIAAGPGPARGQTYLYAGDIGDNEREREFVVVYRFPEPQAGAEGEAGTDAARATEPAEAIRLKYP